MPDQQLPSPAGHARHFSTWLLVPVAEGLDVVPMAEPSSRDLLWRTARHTADVPETGRRLFPGPFPQQNALFREYRSFVHQAQSYDAAAATVRSSSASLLYYYSALNLAKAELLRTVSPAVLRQRIKHGLSAAITSTPSIKGDAVVVQNGVFPLLYEARTGAILPPRTRLPIRRLLQSVPEVGWEVEELGIGRSLVAGFVNAVVTNFAESWVFVALLASHWSLQGQTRRLFLKHFKRVEPPLDWTDRMAIGRRSTLLPWTFWESTHKAPGSVLQSLTDLNNLIEGVYRPLAPIVYSHTLDLYDGLLAPSMFRTRMVPMPPFLARYALMFYVSSLVRYRPSKLDPLTQAAQSWLLDAFVDQTSLRMLEGSLIGLTGRLYRFEATSSVRQ